MTQMNLAGLGLALPPETITWGGFGLPVMINLTKLAGENLTPESSALEAMMKLLNGLHEQQIALNPVRKASNLPPINVVTRTVDTTESGNPVVNMTLALEIDLNAALSNLVDPTEG